MAGEAEGGALGGRRREQSMGSKSVKLACLGRIGSETD